MTQNANKLEELLEQRIVRDRSVASVVRESLISIEKALDAGIGFDEIVLDIQEAYSLKINTNTLRSAVQRERKKLAAKNEGSQSFTPAKKGESETTPTKRTNKMTSDNSKCNIPIVSKYDTPKSSKEASYDKAQEYINKYRTDGY